MTKILIAEPDNFSPKAVQIASQAGEVDLRNISSSKLQWAFETYDVFWFRLGFRITEELLRTPNRRTRIIVCPATGLDHIALETCQELNVQVISLKGETEFLSSVRATAELTFGLTLSLLRKIPQAIEDVRKGKWDRDRFKGSEILGKTIGIIGVGRLGKIVGQYFQAFGSKVLGYDVKDFEAPFITKVNSLEELVSRSDIVSLHVNYETSNHHLVNSALLEKFKPGSILINTSRGGLVDEEALIISLKNGQLGGAAVDVIENEHFFQKSPLIQYAREYDNLLITPHIGGNTGESFVKTEVFAAKKLVKALKHE